MQRLPWCVEDALSKLEWCGRDGVPWYQPHGTPWERVLHFKFIEDLFEMIGNEESMIG